MARSLGEQNREWYARYKDDVKKEGKAFFPRAMLHDTVMGIVVLLVITGLAIIWYYGAGDTPEGEGLEPGILGPLYTEPAEPGTTDFVPRPDWYFYFLFYLLRIFEWPETVVIATVGIPTILLVLLLGLPFYDRRRERRPSRRPVAMVAAVLTILSMGVLTYKGATAKEALGTELVALVPSGLSSRASWGTRKPRPARPSSPRPGASNATRTWEAEPEIWGHPTCPQIGRTNDAAYFVQYLSNPSRFGNTVMGSYAYLGEENLAALGAFLEASKGGESESESP